MEVLYPKAGVTGIQEKAREAFRLQCYRRCLIEDYCTGRISRRIDEDPNVPYLVLITNQRLIGA